MTYSSGRWVNENLIRRTGGKPSYRPAPGPYVPAPDDAAPDPRPFAVWTRRCEAADCPAVPRVCLIRMVVHQHLDWPDRVAASVQTRCLCRHHGHSDAVMLLERKGWREIATRDLT
jgi:hypothetical protein